MSRTAFGFAGDGAPAMHDRRVGKPFCNDWHDRAIRQIGCTRRDDRRELVDLRDRDERLHVVDELRGALGLHTIRESGLVVDEDRRIACSEPVVCHVCRLRSAPFHLARGPEGF